MKALWIFLGIANVLGFIAMMWVIFSGLGHWYTPLIAVMNIVSVGLCAVNYDRTL